MLSLTIALSPEGWDEKKEEFVQPKYRTIQLEHSLVALSAWESKWHKSFLDCKEMTVEETLYYIKCMTLNKDVPDEVYAAITQSDMDKVLEYIKDPMTATTFRDDKRRSSGRFVTAELIYYWMITLGVPFECRKWHLNRLLTLIRVCEAENQPKKKMSKSEIMRRNNALNEARRKKYHTRG